MPDAYYTPKNCIVRCAYYGYGTDFILTHFDFSSEFEAMQSTRVPVALPFTQANCDAIIADLDDLFGAGFWPGDEARQRTGLAGLVGFDYNRVYRDLSRIKHFERKYGIPVLLEEFGMVVANPIHLPARRTLFNWITTACRRLKIKANAFSAGKFSSATVVNFGNAAGIVNSDSAKREMQMQTKVFTSGGRVIPPAVWTPADLGAKLLAWYDFSQVTGSNGATVSTLSPRAGSITTPLTSSGASMPTVAATIATMNNTRGIALTATQYMSLSGISQAMPLSMFIAMDPTINTTAGGDRYTHFTDAPSGTRFTTGAFNTNAGDTKNYFLVQSGSVWIDYGVATAAAFWNSPQVFNATWSATTNYGKIRVNGVDLKTGTHTQATLTSLRVGASNSGADGLNGYLTDVILTTALTADERDRLEVWLANKTGVTLTGNPYQDGGVTPSGPSGHG